MKRIIAVFLCILTLCGLLIPAVPAFAKTTVAQVTGFTLKEKNATSIKLGWNAVKGKNIRYEVLLGKESDGKFTIKKISSSTKLTVSGLASATKYRIKIRAVSGSGTAGKYTSVKSLVTKPLKVSNLKVATPGTTSISLKWDKVNRATGYQIYRSTSKTGTYKRVATVRNDLKYTDKGLTSGKVYYYKVRAYKSVDEEKVYGAYSAVNSLTPRLTTTQLKKLIVYANELYYGWMTNAFSVQINRNDYFYKNGTKYCRVINTRFKTKKAITNELKKYFSADVYKSYLNYYAERNGHLYANELVGQGGDISGDSTELDTVTYSGKTITFTLKEYYSFYVSPSYEYVTGKLTFSDGHWKYMSHSDVASDLGMYQRGKF